MQLDPKRVKLVCQVKLLVLEADDETVEALITNVEQLSRIEPRKKKDEDDI